MQEQIDLLLFSSITNVLLTQQKPKSCLADVNYVHLISRRFIEDLVLVHAFLQLLKLLELQWQFHP